MSDAQDAAPLVPANGNSDKEGGEERIVSGLELSEDPAKEDATYFHGLKGADRQGVLTLQSIRSMQRKYNVNELYSKVDAQSRIEDEISFIPRVVELFDQLAKAKQDCTSYTWQNKEKGTILEQRALQYKTM